MIKFITYIIIIQIISINTLNIKGDELLGPIITTVVDRREIVFKDLGTGRTWSSIEDAGLDLGEIGFRGWSPDGCMILLELEDDAAVLSIADLSIQRLPNLENGRYHWLWHPVDNAVAVSVTEGVDITSLYFLDVESWELQKLFSVNSGVTPIQWLTSEELLYAAAYSRYVWNMSSGESQPVDEKGHNYPYPLGTLAPGEWDLYGCYFRHYLSPNRMILARHYSLADYYYALSEDVDGVCEDPAENPPLSGQSGLDLHFYNTDTTMHINIYNYFVRYLAWSPSAQQLLIVTTDGDPKGVRLAHKESRGVYIYDVAQDQLERLEDFLSPVVFRPTWSPDGQWLAGGFTEQGLSAYHLSDGKVVPLDEERFLGIPKSGIGIKVQLYWSPVMDYSEARCSAGE